MCAVAVYFYKPHLNLTTFVNGMKILKYRRCDALKLFAVEIKRLASNVMCTIYKYIRFDK